MNYQGHIELVTSIALVIVVFIGNPAIRTQFRKA